MNKFRKICLMESTMIRHAYEKHGEEMMVYTFAIMNKICKEHKIPLRILRNTKGDLPYMKIPSNVVIAILVLIRLTIWLEIEWIKSNLRRMLLT